MKKGKRYKTLYLPALIIVLTVVVLLVVIAVSTYQNIDRERSRTDEFLLREGMSLLRAIEAGVRVDFPASHPDVSRVQKLIAEIGEEPEIARILLFDEEGNLLAGGPAQGEEQKIQEAASLPLLFWEKGWISRYMQLPSGEKTYEIIKPFRPFLSKDPLAVVRETGKRTPSGENPLQQWAKDKIISLNLRVGAFEKARKEDIHHAFLMGGILVVLGTGAIYFILIVQNYYLVDRTLAEMKTYTENVVESMADGLLSVDRDRMIVTLNRRAAEFLGAGEEDLKRKEIPGALGKEVEDLLEGRSSTIRDREVELLQPSGERVPLSLSATPLRDEAGREMGAVLLLKDLREIRDLQKRVRRSERLASLGRLAAGVAHEIRNPLSSIRGFAQFFLNRFKGQEEEQGYALIMIKEVDRLNRVITELLDFAKPKEPHRELHSLEPIIEHALKVLEPDMLRKKAAVVKDYEPNLPPVLADRDQISQVFLNLLLNSLESIEERGEIRVSLKKWGDHPSLEVTIADTGKGIAPADVGKIFEPFFSTKPKGTGLGLAIVHQIVESHGGDIEVESREGQGTTFRITLPVH